MGIPYSADEIFEMAEQIERNGAKFYRKAAETAQRAEAREHFSQLAKMEDGHEALFASIRAQLPAEAAQPSIFDPYGESALYLQAAADTHIFNVHKDITQILTGKETPTEVLMIAISFEKDTIAFFLGMRDAVPESLGKKDMEELIKQEMGHVSELTAQMSALS